MAGRLARGRTYARTGQVMSLSLSTSLVVALVTGTRPSRTGRGSGCGSSATTDWRRIEHALADRAIFAAKLLAGEMPPEIEDVFADLGLTLFPSTMRELHMDCTCPDWEVPCKHLAATCYLLAESFDTDPFEILAWRGRSREDLLDRLRDLRAPIPRRAARDRRAKPPEDSFGTFWARPKVAEVVPDVAEPTTRRPDALLDQLEPLVVDGRSVTDALRPLYRRIGAAAVSRPRPTAGSAPPRPGERGVRAGQPAALLAVHVEVHVTAQPGALVAQPPVQQRVPRGQVVEQRAQRGGLRQVDLQPGLVAGRLPERPRDQHEHPHVTPPPRARTARRAGARRSAASSRPRRRSRTPRPTASRSRRRPGSPSSGAHRVTQHGRPEAVRQAVAQRLPRRPGVRRLR